MYLLAKVKAFLFLWKFEYNLSKKEQVKMGEFWLKLMSKEIHILLNCFRFFCVSFFRVRSLRHERKVIFLLEIEMIF